jgi:hypothetical protein
MPECSDPQSDYAMLINIYGLDPEKKKRYSPEKCIEAERTPITGNPEQKHISTSYVERQNLTMRMNMRRFRLLPKAFSNIIENLAYAVALHFMYYNFGWIHQTLRVTPAMEAKISDHVWTLGKIARLAD